MNLNMIVATDEKGGFSKNGTIPWIKEDFIKPDMVKFIKLTTQSVVIMGRKTYEDIASITKADVILPNRYCVVLSRNPKYFIAEGIQVQPSLQDAIEVNMDREEPIFILGGLSLFNEGLSWQLNRIYMTRIKRDYQCDQFFPFDKLEQRYVKDSSVNFNEFLTFDEYRSNHA